MCERTGGDYGNVEMADGGNAESPVESVLGSEPFQGPPSSNPKTFIKTIKPYTKNTTFSSLSSLIVYSFKGPVTYQRAVTARCVGSHCAAVLWLAGAFGSVQMECEDGVCEEILKEAEPHVEETHTPFSLDPQNLSGKDENFSKKGE
ncbi:hypothetical protein SRHO_G00311360 [Serrasalmus rhombeus]